MKNIINLLFLFTILVVTSCETPVNTGTIHGVVTDYATGEPIKNAGVTLMPIGNTTITGSEGQFQFDNLEPRTYQLMIQKIGYEILTTTNLQLSLGAIIPQNLQMTVMPPSLKVLDDKRNPIDTLFFGVGVLDDNVRLFNILNDGVEDLNWEILSNSKWIKSIKPQSGVLKTTETVGVIVEINRSIMTNIEGELSSLHVVTDNGSKEIMLCVRKNLNLCSTFIYKDNVYLVLPQKFTDCYYDWYEAIEVCDNITYAGYNDWYLPNKSELNAMCENKSEIGGFFSDDNYWSSTEGTRGWAMCQFFGSANQYGSEKIYSNRVRCVRRD